MNARDARVVDRDKRIGRTRLRRPRPLGWDRHPRFATCIWIVSRWSMCGSPSPQQVLENRESRERQYALAQFAQRLGLAGRARRDHRRGSRTERQDRPTIARGFSGLMTEVSLNHVGIVLGLELSRLSRSNKDWHQLIDVCGIFNTLLCDQDGVYDPLDSNDRLLLGMKGAMSEYELVTLRNRLLRGSRNKAERGELFLPVPVGYLKTSTGEIVQEPDEQARGMIQLVFDKFEELGSAYAVFRYLVVNDLQLGFRRQRGGTHRGVGMAAAVAQSHPGDLATPDLCGGLRLRPAPRGDEESGDGAHGRRQVVRAARGDCPCCCRDRLPAYISWDQYLANQERLKQNRSLHDTRGVPKRGAALLPGLVVCGKCGHRMATRYKADKRPSYYCDEYWRSALDEPCGRITAATLDDLVVEEVLRALGTGRAGTQPARHRERRAGAQAPARPVASEARTRAARGRAGPSDNITPWSPRIDSWRERWRRAGRRP